MRSRSSCEDQPHVTGDQFVAGIAHHVTADAGAEVKAFNAYAVWCKDQTHDDGRQQETLDANIASTNAAIENSCRQQETLDANIASTNAAIENFATVRGWGPDARVELMVPGASVTIAQHTEGRGESGNAMLDLSVSWVDKSC